MLSHDYRNVWQNRALMAKKIHSTLEMASFCKTSKQCLPLLRSFLIECQIARTRKVIICKIPSW